MAMWLHVLALLPVAVSSSREVVNFDFGWRHHLGLHGTPSPPSPPRSCDGAIITHGENWVSATHVT
jgi:hypothetical protein